MFTFEVMTTFSASDPEVDDNFIAPGTGLAGIFDLFFGMSFLK